MHLPISDFLETVVVCFDHTLIIITLFFYFSFSCQFCFKLDLFWICGNGRFLRKSLRAYFFSGLTSLGDFGLNLLFRFTTPTLNFCQLRSFPTRIFGYCSWSVSWVVLIRKEDFRFFWWLDSKIFCGFPDLCFRLWSPNSRVGCLLGVFFAFTLGGFNRNGISISTISLVEILCVNFEMAELDKHLKTCSLKKNLEGLIQHVSLFCSYQFSFCNFFQSAPSSSGT